MPIPVPNSDRTPAQPAMHRSILSIHRNPCPSVRPSIHAEKKLTNIHLEKPRGNANKRTASLVVLGCQRGRRHDNIIQPLSKEERGRQHHACTLRNAIPSALKRKPDAKNAEIERKVKPVYKNHPLALLNVPQSAPCPS